MEIKAVAREAGSRSKIAISSNDEHIDPVGSLVGQRGVRVSTVMSELGGEKIDVIEWSEDPAQFIEDALSPATVLSVEINEEEKKSNCRCIPRPAIARHRKRWAKCKTCCKTNRLENRYKVHR